MNIFEVMKAKKEENIDAMVWYRKIDGNDFVLVICTNTRNLLDVECSTSKNPLSYDEYKEVLHDSVYAIEKHETGLQVNPVTFQIEKSIETFLDGNEELIDSVSFDIYQEDERFWNSEMWD
jgi:hypothetical protein